MNLVMQFRKVCNHPDLFERADVVSPFVFGTFSQSGSFSREPDVLYCPDSGKNAIDVEIPRLIWEDKLDRPQEEGYVGSRAHVLGNLMSIWRTDWISRSLEERAELESGFGFCKVLDISPGEASRRARSHPLVTVLREAEGEKENIEEGAFERYVAASLHTCERAEAELTICSDSAFAASSIFKLPPLAPSIPSTRPASTVALRDITTSAWNTSYLSRSDARFAVESAVAPFIRPTVSSRSFVNTQSRLSADPLLHTALYGLAPSARNDLSSSRRLEELAPGVSSIGLLQSSPPSQGPMSTMAVPSLKRLIVDSAKLARLDELLRQLKDEGHRVLLYFQMTKMMDLVEEYLIYRQYKYLRLDGSSAIGDRRDMVTSWQTK